MSPPDYDANLVPAPSLTREFESLPGYHETQVRAAFKAHYSKAVEEIVKDIAPTDFRCLFVSTKENFSVRTNKRGSNMQGGTRTVAGAVAGTNTQEGSSPPLHVRTYSVQTPFPELIITTLLFLSISSFCRAANAAAEEGSQDNKVLIFL